MHNQRDDMQILGGIGDADAADNDSAEFTENVVYIFRLAFSFGNDDSNGSNSFIDVPSPKTSPPLEGGD
jgi:hypothetical protein